MPYKVLFVDDNPIKSQLVLARLRRQGYEVLDAQNGKQALDLFAANEVDLAVVDYYMPEMNGDVVALEMKKSKPQVPIVIFSGAFTLPEMVIAYVEGFVSSSDEPDALLKKIAEILERRAQRAS
jgi:DNA-binding NtrC family response regulator